MRLKKTVKNKVYVVIKCPKTKKSKTITVYDCDIDTMISSITKMITGNN